MNESITYYTFEDREKEVPLILEMVSNNYSLAFACMNFADGVKSEKLFTLDGDVVADLIKNDFSIDFLVKFGLSILQLIEDGDLGLDLKQVQKSQ